MAVAAALLMPLLAAGTVPAATSEGGRTEQEAVRVTAGDHDGFSRVVFNFDARVDFQLHSEPGAIRVLFPGADYRFEVSAVNVNRRARRVERAEADGSPAHAGLRLHLTCPCVARTFFHEGRLVVDIRDPDRPPSRPQATRDAAAGMPPDARTSPPARDVPVRAEQADDAVAISPGIQDGPRAEFVRRVEGLDAGRDIEPAASGMEAEDLRRRLLWAIERGYLSSATDEGVVESGEPPAAHVAGPAERVAAGQATDPPRDPAPAREERAADGGAAEECAAAAAIDPATWAGQATFTQELAVRQAALGAALASGDGVEAEQLALARFYFARSMPQEALATLDDLQDGSAPGAAWLRGAALLLADRVTEVAPDWLSHSVCATGDGQLWRLMVPDARPEGEAGPPWPADVADRLSLYPSPLRIELGLRLAASALEAGAPDAAGRLLAVVEAATPGQEQLARMLFLRGRLFNLRGEFAAALDAWERAAQLPGEDGARAFLELVTAATERDEPADSGRLERLERLAIAWRGHPLEVEVAKTAAGLYERENRLTEALRALEDVALAAPAQANSRGAARLATDLLRRHLADRPLAADQLAAFWRFEGFVPPGADGADIRLGFARSLLAHGLPGPAARLLGPLAADGPEALRSEAALLLAEAQMMRGDAEAALAVLTANARRAAEPTAEASLIAARALASFGRFAEAAGLLHGIADPDAESLAAQYLWNAGLWSQAVDANQRILNRPAGQDPDEAPRAAARLASAAYMSSRPRPPGDPADGDSGEADAVEAFLAQPELGAPRSARAHALVNQADQLASFAARYGVKE